MIIELKWPDSTPTTEFSKEFLQAMLDRVAHSYARYGAMKDAYPHKVDALKSAELRLDKYKETGNLEYVVDSANFNMIEFIHPRKVDAYWDARAKSPGRVWHREVDPLRDRNKP
jgi:hypothetical protein